MLIRVTNGADSIFEVSLLIPLSHGATSAAENDEGPITHKLLGWEKFCFQKWNLYAETSLETKLKVSTTVIMVFWSAIHFIYNIMGMNRQGQVLI